VNHDNNLRNLVSNICRALNNGGYVWNYFAQNKEFECELRRLFTQFQTSSPNQWNQDEFVSAAQELRIGYSVERTIAVNNVQNLCDCLRNGLNNFHPPLYDVLIVDEQQISIIPECFQNIIQTFCNVHGVNRPISFTSKLLHFLYPNAFPIIDTYTEKCLTLCVNHLYQDNNPRGNNHGRDNLRDFYSFILGFYRRLLHDMLDNERGCIEDKIGVLKKEFDLPFFTKLDAFDKYFWMAFRNSLKKELFGVRQNYNVWKNVIMI
jgi:hypothetical protein